ncbi:hypothetical protein [Prevotella sp. P6B1]|uniref:hypothetical protein n=1 Tax=Prevotella sp. P6B1 TaxID=1410613 RepID=UPI0012DFB01B|nr:hypothetical protein [Prevotella sp. P6B1]
MKRVISRSMILICFVGLVCVTLMSSCSKEEKDEGPKYSEEQLYVRPWQEYPQSYIKFFDYRMTFRLLNIQRNGSALQVDYVLTNTGFNQEVELLFEMPDIAAHDDLGNSYSGKFGNNADVVSTINGESFSSYGYAKRVKFMPNQAIKGSFTIKNFDINAAQFSYTCKVSLGTTKGITLVYNRIDFVNIPVETGEYQNM